MTRTMTIAAALTVALFAAATGVRGEDKPRYRLVENFFEFPDVTFGAVAGVAIDAKGRIAVTHRGPQPVMLFEPSGKLIRTFGDGHLIQVHGTRWDADGNLWTTDIKNHTVVKFSPEGEVLLKLGEMNKPGDDETHFNRPTDVAFGRDGTFFVSDGYGNSRVVKFSKEGKFIKAFGGTGKSSAIGEFNLPHCVQMDAQGLLHIADRENDRIQVFDQDGKYVRHYGGFAPFGIFIATAADGSQTLYVADGRAHKAYHMTLEGKVLHSWGELGSAKGAYFNLPHGITADKDGNVYVTEITGKRIQKFAPVK